MPSVALHFGWMVTDRTAILMDLWTVIEGEDLPAYHGEFTTELESTQSAIVSLGVRHWVLPRLWVLGGVGSWVLGAAERRCVAGAGCVSQSYRADEGIGWRLGAGYEVTYSRHFALDVQAGVALFSGDTTGAEIAVQVGFSWNK